MLLQPKSGGYDQKEISGAGSVPPPHFQFRSDDILERKTNQKSQAESQWVSPDYKFIYRTMFITERLSSPSSQLQQLFATFSL